MTQDLADKDKQGIAWKSITAFDVITDTITFGLSIFLVWGIQMRWKEKATVIFAFGTRTPYVSDRMEEIQQMSR